MGAITGQQVVGASTSVLESGVGVASATGALAPIAAGLGISVPVLGAIIGAGIMAAAAAIDAIMNSGCGQTCIVSTQFANQANSALQQNIEAYFALPTPRPLSAQRAALSNFDTFWAWLQQPSQCGNPNLGTAGQRCISDRAAGACTWKQPANEVPPWGTPPAGACWNWQSGYRDPIADDPNVYDDSLDVQQSSAALYAVTQTAQVAGSSLPVSTSGISPLLLLVGAGALLWAVS